MIRRSEVQLATLAIVSLIECLYAQLPIVTRLYVTSCFLVTAACALEVRLDLRLSAIRIPDEIERLLWCQKLKCEMFLCQVQIITPFNIYFNARLIYQKWELWRLLTNFLFFGSLGKCLDIGSMPLDSSATVLVFFEHQLRQ